MIRYFLITLIIFAFVSHAALADDHAADPGEMVTLNLCTLNPGNTLADVEKFQNSWIKWAKSRDIDLFNEILTPLMINTSGTPTLDFIELSVTSYADGGRMWADWNETKKGQKMAQQWSEMANCSARVNHLVTKYQDPDADTNDRSRVVTFTRCEIHDGVTGDDMRAVHQRGIDRRSDTATNMFWGLLLPRAGGDDARNVFRHANVYSDMQSYVAQLATHSQRAQMIRDYNQRYAQCDKPTIWASNVLSLQED